MNDSKALKKDIRKTIDEITHTCKRIPEKDINKLLEKLKEKVSSLSTSDLESISQDREELSERYSECMQLQKDTDSLFVNIRNYQLDLKEINKKLEGLKDKLENYITEIEIAVKTNPEINWGEILMLIRQNQSVIDLWTKNNEKLIEQIENSFTLTINGFKTYIDIIVKYQRLLFR